jgi:hypothetical protein
VKILILAIAWLISGVASYGLIFHYLQTRFRYFAWPQRRMHRLTALASGLVPPVGILVRYLNGLHDDVRTPWGLQYRAVTSEESWQAFHAEWPTLSKDRWLSSE